MKNLFVFAIVVVLLSGCNNNNNNIAEKSGETPIQVKNTNISEVDRQTGQDIAHHLVELTTDMPNIKDATAVVLGRYAIVGIDVDENIDRSEVGSIKYAVAESLKNDPHGAKAIVVADPDVTARLKEIAEDVENGKPIQGIVNELADISGRLIPEIPADIIDSNPKKAVNEPKKQLNKGEKKTLENKQQEESNYYKD